MPDVVFTLYDPKRGPNTIFTTINDDVAKKIAYKSHLTVAMEDKVENNHSTEAVLPFPDLKKTGYVQLFNVQCGETKTLLCALIYLVDTEQQLKLYKNASLLKYEAQRIIDGIKSGMKDINNPKFDKTLCSKLKNWGKSLDKTSIDIAAQYEDQDITIEKKKISGSIPFLFEYFTNDKDLTCIITTLLKNEPLIVHVSDLTKKRKLITCFISFLPHKIPKRQVVHEYVDPKQADILITQNNSLLTAYKEYTIVNLDTRRVTSKTTSSRFVSKLLKDIKNENHDDALLIIEERVSWLLDKVSQLTEVFIPDQSNQRQTQQRRSQAIRKIREEAPGSFGIIKEICATVNPVIKDLIQKETYEELERSSMNIGFGGGIF